MGLPISYFLPRKEFMKSYRLLKSVNRDTSWYLKNPCRLLLSVTNFFLTGLRLLGMFIFQSLFLCRLRLCRDSQSRALTLISSTMSGLTCLTESKLGWLLLMSSISLSLKPQPLMRP